MIVSDHLGWVEPKKEKHSTDLIFSKKHVHDLIKRNLKKVGIDADKEKELEWVNIRPSQILIDLYYIFLFIPHSFISPL